jgi:hypothetical protein
VCGSPARRSPGRSTWPGPGFEAHANTSVAAVRLAHAHEVRSLRIDQVLVTNTQAAPVLDLTEATVDGPLWFRLVA